MTADGSVPAVWFPAIQAGSGADVFTERLVDGLKQRGIRAEIGWLPHRAEFAPWSVASPSPPSWANLVHVNTWLPRRFLPRRLPMVATTHHCVHGEAAPIGSAVQRLYHRLWVKSLEKEVLCRADRVTAVSHYTARRTAAVFSIDDIAVIHNGVQLDVFTPGSPRYAPHTPFRLFYVGSWSRRKGVDLLAPIMSELGEDFELLHTGEAASQHPPNMRAIGRVTDVTALVDLYRGADALLFPTRLEGFGLVALEAQACGAPVVATRGSSLPEVVEDGVSGFLCPQDDMSAFVGAVRTLAADPGQWRQMRRAARCRAEALFGFDKMVEEYINLYRDLLSARH